ncbi:MAG: YceI family protein [Polyangiales bacterium]
MPQYDADNAECLVFSSKDGLLAGLAHDLKMRVDRFSVEVDTAHKTVEASFDPHSVRVVCAQIDGRDQPSLLSPGDRDRIDENIASEVLHADRHPEIRFESTAVTPRDRGYTLEGLLSLHGQRRAVVAEVESAGDQWVTEVSIHQQDFGIRPFKAALGTLRIKPDVLVQLRVPRQV